MVLVSAKQVKRKSSELVIELLAGGIVPFRRQDAPFTQQDCNETFVPGQQKFAQRHHFRKKQCRMCCRPNNVFSGVTGVTKRKRPFVTGNGRFSGNCRLKV
jgi:hypothetical protein